MAYCPAIKMNSFYAMNLEIVVLSERKWRIIKDGAKNDLYHFRSQGSATKKERAELISHPSMLNPLCLSPQGWPPCCPLLKRMGPVQKSSYWSDLFKLLLWNVFLEWSGVNSAQKAAELESVLYAWFMFSIFKSLLWDTPVYSITHNMCGTIIVIVKRAAWRH